MVSILRPCPGELGSRMARGGPAGQGISRLGTFPLPPFEQFLLVDINIPNLDNPMHIIYLKYTPKLCRILSPNAPFRVRVAHENWNELMPLTGPSCLYSLLIAGFQAFFIGAYIPPVPVFNPILTNPSHISTPALTGSNTVIPSPQASLTAVSSPTMPAHPRTITSAFLPSFSSCFALSPSTFRTCSRGKCSKSNTDRPEETTPADKREDKLRR